MKNLLSPTQNTIISLILFKISSFTKISFMVGSGFAFFSGTSIILPLTGAFAGMPGTLAAFAALSILKLLTGTTLFSLHMLAFYIPGFIAALYWATSSWIRIIPPLLALALFINHPIGSQAALYSLFWLTPIVTTLFFTHNLFARALGSTFTAHAVGSVIWLYTIPMTGDQWLMLIPVVIIERLLFASGMVIVYKALKNCSHVLCILRYKNLRVHSE